LYGMAYAANTDELPIAKGLAGTNAGEVWFGHEPSLIPPRAQPAPNASRAGQSKVYLDKARQHYRTALDLNASSLLGRIGYAWILEQSGDKAGAVAEYRRVIERAWPKEMSKKFADLGERFYTQEAAEHLVPLLDAKSDTAEIAELKERISRFQAMPRPVTPIAIPLSDNATVSSIVDLNAQVRFDADGSGHHRRWTWISADAGWLVYDATRKGRITSALQWFGNVTFWLFWKTGYDALASLDDNRDSELKGAELRYLSVWRDVDQDGVSDQGEVRPVNDYGIVAISCVHVSGDGLLVAAKSSQGVRLKDGRVRPTYDVILRPSWSVSAPAPQ